METSSFRRDFGVLREREFRLLWGGQLVSAIGDALVPVVIPFAVLDLTGSAADLLRAGVPSLRTLRRGDVGPDVLADDAAHGRSPVAA